MAGARIHPLRCTSVATTCPRQWLLVRLPPAAGPAQETQSTPAPLTPGNHPSALRTKGAGRPLRGAPPAAGGTTPHKPSIGSKPPAEVAPRRRLGILQVCRLHPHDDNKLNEQFIVVKLTRRRRHGKRTPEVQAGLSRRPVRGTWALRTAQWASRSSRTG